MITTTLADGTPVSDGVGTVIIQDTTLIGILGIGIHGTTRDTTLGTTVLIGDGAEVGTPDGMVVGQADGAGQVAGMTLGTLDHPIETMYIMADQPIADMAEILMEDTLQEEATTMEEPRTTDIVREAELRTDVIAATMFAQQDVTVADVQQMTGTIPTMITGIAREDAVLLQENLEE